MVSWNNSPTTPIGIDPRMIAHPYRQSGSRRAAAPNSPRNQAATIRSEVPPQEDHRRQHRTGLDDRGERGDVRIVDGVTEQLLGDGQVPGARDRQELGDPLDRAQQHRFEDVQPNPRPVIHRLTAVENRRAVSRRCAGPARRRSCTPGPDPGCADPGRTGGWSADRRAPSRPARPPAAPPRPAPSWRTHAATSAATTAPTTRCPASRASRRTSRNTECRSMPRPGRRDEQRPVRPAPGQVRVQRRARVRR